MMLRDKDGYIVDVCPEKKEMWDEFIKLNYEEIDWKQQSKEWISLAKFYRAEKDKYKWLYHVVCLALHDTIGIPLEEIKKDFEHLWNLTQIRKENKKNVN